MSAAFKDTRKTYITINRDPDDNSWVKINGAEVLVEEGSLKVTASDDYVTRVTMTIFPASVSIIDRSLNMHDFTAADIEKLGMAEISRMQIDYHARSLARGTQPE